MKNETKLSLRLALSRVQITEEISILVIFITLVVIVGLFIPEFRSIYNIFSVIRQFSLICIVAMGETVVLISGCFDLSVGSIAALGGMFTAHMMVTFGWPIWLSVILGTLIGAFCGFINGILVGKIKLNPLISTLATSWIFTGIVLVTTRGWPVANMPQGFLFIGQGHLLGIPFPIIMMISVGVVLSLILSQMVIGRYVYAVGGNEKASVLSGINVATGKIVVFTICGLLSSLAGITLASRMGSAQATGGADWTLPAIASAVIGGVSLSGGKGKIYGAIIGSALIGVINNILVLLHISSYWQTLITGLIVLVAVMIDAIRKNR